MFKKLRFGGFVLMAFITMTALLAGCGDGKRSGASRSSASPAAASTSPSASPATASPSPASTVELTISAAASLTDALKEIQTGYEASHRSVKLIFNFGASGTLQQQIEQGAPADLFLSAATKNMKALVDKQLVDAAKQTNLLANELVVVVPADGKIAIARESDLTKEDVKSIAIGIPESVPAGSYAKEALTNVKLWEELQAKTVQAKDVKQVLQYVETGNADAGFVYRTDALVSQKAKVAFAVDPKQYMPALYPIGIVKATKHAKEAEDFYAYLQTQEALNVFVKYGFSVAR